MAVKCWNKLSFLLFSFSFAQQINQHTFTRIHILSKTLKQTKAAPSIKREYSDFLVVYIEIVFEPNKKNQIQSIFPHTE